MPTFPVIWREVWGLSFAWVWIPRGLRLAYVARVCLLLRLCDLLDLLELLDQLPSPTSPRACAYARACVLLSRVMLLPVALIFLCRRRALVLTGYFGSDIVDGLVGRWVLPVTED